MSSLPTPGEVAARSIRVNREAMAPIFGLRVALEEIADGVWSIYFYDLLLARWDERTSQLSG